MEQFKPKTEVEDIFSQIDKVAQTDNAKTEKQKQQAQIDFKEIQQKRVEYFKTIEAQKDPEAEVAKAESEVDRNYEQQLESTMNNKYVAAMVAQEAVESVDTGKEARYNPTADFYSNIGQAVQKLLDARTT